MAQGGDEQAATRALADSAQDRQGRMFDTHHHWLNVALKQNDELMRRIAASENWFPAAGLRPVRCVEAVG